MEVEGRGEFACTWRGLVKERKREREEEEENREEKGYRIKAYLFHGGRGRGVRMPLGGVGIVRIPFNTVPRVRVRVRFRVKIKIEVTITIIMIGLN
jgi:hypothetical protein